MAYILILSLHRSRKVRLNLIALWALHDQIVNRFQQWVNAAPDNYKADHFLLERTPLVITSRYGQNQDIAVEAVDAAVDAENWQADRDFSQIRYITMAIATHLRYAIASPGEK